MLYREARAYLPLPTGGLGSGSCPEVVNKCKLTNCRTMWALVRLVSLVRTRDNLTRQINQPQHVVSNLVARMLSNCKTVLIREQRDHFQDEMARDNDLHNINNRYNYLFFIVLRERCYMKYYQAISIRSKLWQLSALLSSNCWLLFETPAILIQEETLSLNSARIWHRTVWEMLTRRDSRLKMTGWLWAGWLSSAVRIETQAWK